MSYSRTHVLLMEDNASGGLAATGTDSPIPGRFPQNQMDFPHAREITIIISVAAVTGAPTAWSLGVKWQFCQPHTSGLYLTNPRYFDLQAEQVANLTAEGIGWYSGSHLKPVGGEFGVISDQSDTLPITVSRTMKSGFGGRVHIDTDRQFTGGTAPKIQASIILVERG